MGEERTEVLSPAQRASELLLLHLNRNDINCAEAKTRCSHGVSGLWRGGEKDPGYGDGDGDAIV